jgi:hypothetical protein
MCAASLCFRIGDVAPCSRRSAAPAVLTLLSTPGHVRHWQHGSIMAAWLHPAGRPASLQRRFVTRNGRTVWLRRTFPATDGCVLPALLAFVAYSLSACCWMAAVYRMRSLSIARSLMPALLALLVSLANSWFSAACWFASPYALVAFFP